MGFIDKMRERATEVCMDKFPTRDESIGIIESQFQRFMASEKKGMSNIEKAAEASFDYILKIISEGAVIDDELVMSVDNRSNDWVRSPDYVTTMVFGRIKDFLRSKDPLPVDKQALEAKIRAIIEKEVSKVINVIFLKKVPEGVEEVTVINKSYGVNLFNAISVIMAESGMYKTLGEMIARETDCFKTMPLLELLSFAYHYESVKGDVRNKIKATLNSSI